MQKQAVKGPFVDEEIVEIEVKANSGRAKNQAYCSAGAGLSRIKQR